MTARSGGSPARADANDADADAMVRIVEIAHGEAVGIGLAGSELPRRRANATKPRDAGRASGTSGTRAVERAVENERVTRARTLGATVTRAIAIVIVVVAVRFAARVYGW